MKTDHQRCLNRKAPASQASPGSPAAPKKALLLLVVLLVLRIPPVRPGGSALSSCVNLTSTMDGAGDPGPGSNACLPYNIELSAAAGMVRLSEATAATAALAPAMDVSVIVDESGSVKTLCKGTLDCYNNERDFATELVTLLNRAVGFFAKGGTALYMEYSTAVNTEAQYKTEADYLACEETSLLHCMLILLRSDPPSAGGGVKRHTLDVSTPGSSKLQHAVSPLL